VRVLQGAREWRVPSNVIGSVVTIVDREYSPSLSMRVYGVLDASGMMRSVEESMLESVSSRSVALPDLTNVTVANVAGSFQWEGQILCTEYIDQRGLPIYRIRGSGGTIQMIPHDQVTVRQ
jgi:hypothetical protein